MSDGEISVPDPSEMIHFTKYLQKYADIQPRTYWWEFPFYTIIMSARQKLCLGNRPEDPAHITTIEKRTREKHLTRFREMIEDLEEKRAFFVVKKLA